MNVSLAAAVALIAVFAVPTSPAAAPQSHARAVPAAGHLNVTAFGPHAGHAARPSGLVAPHHIRDNAAHAAAKKRAAGALAGGSTSARPTIPKALITGLDQPGLSVFDELFCCTPADPTGAIGPNHYLEMVNTLVGVYRRNDLGLLSSMDLASFTAAPAGLTLSDPQIEWDFQANRWFYLAVAFATGNNFLVFGWSKTSDPSDLTNGWCRFGVGTGSSLNDFPKLGHDDNYLLFGSNVYDDSQAGEPFVTAQVWAVAKPAFGDSACTVPSVATYFADATHLLLNADGTPADTPVPANTTESSSGGYIIAAHSPLTAPAGSRSKVMVWHMTKQAGSPALVADGDISVNPYDVPADVPQPVNMLDTLDAQLTQAVARLDPDAGALAIWTQHTIAGPGGRSVVRWYELLPASLAVRQQGEVSSPTDFIFNGAISTSIAGNDAVIEYNRASSTATPVIAAQSRIGSTPLGTMDAGEVLLGSSTDVDQDISCNAPYGPPCRWGDYSGVTPDPLNAGVVWGSNMVNGPSLFGFPQWTTQNFSIATGATAAPDFSLAASPSSQTVTTGAGTSYTVTITPSGGFAGSVTLSLTGLPSGASSSFSPNPATTTSTLAVSTDASTPVGSYPLTITGTSGSLSHMASATLVVNAASAPDFSLSAAPPSRTVGGSVKATSYSVAIQQMNGFNGSVTLSLAGLPVGASAIFSPNPATTASTLNVTILSSTPNGSYVLTITGTSGSLIHTTTVTLIVNADFRLKSTPTTVTVARGSRADYKLTIVKLNGFSDAVTLSVSPLPARTTVTFTVNPATNSSTMRIKTTARTVPGTYTLTISGTSGGLTHVVTVTLVVT